MPQAIRRDDIRNRLMRVRCVVKKSGLEYRQMELGLGYGIYQSGMLESR